MRQNIGETAVSSNPQFLFDFGSPNAFLSHEAIPAIEKRTGAKFEYVPILLGGIFKATNNKSPAERSPASRTSANSTRWRPSAS
jgi:2-hydroxychromene-2-carboxylate isomerase